MKNFVIINGTNSNTITGLAINELPPITKPQLRVLTEEIDGRDGDITTPLGYSAYDKTFTIGLFGDGYDINDIVSFFNDSGTIVFSNEPDKYYKFETIAQIDYESLLKFKTASITIHCQPFKYPLTETPLEIEYDYIEQTGENLNINNTAEAPMKLSLKGNTSQYTTTGKQLIKKKGLSTPKTDTNFWGNASTEFTPLENGWGRYSYDNSSGSSTKEIWSSIKLNGAKLEPNKQYTIILETRNITYTGNARIILVQSNSAEAFTPASGDIYLRNITGTLKYLKTTKSDLTNVTLCLRLFVALSVGDKCNFEARVSIVEGDYTSTDYTYEEYTGGIPAPNPDYPQTIHSVSGDNEIKVCGKNLVEAIITHTNISAEGEIVYHNDYDLHIAKIVQGKTYTMTTTVANDKVLGFFINYPTINSNTYNNSRVIQSSYTFTAPITGYVAFRSATGYSTPMLEVGETATTYEPYQSQTYPINLPKENEFDEEFRQGDENSTSAATSIFSKNDLVLKAGDYTFTCNLPMTTYKYAIGTKQSAFPGTATWIGGGFQTNQTLQFTLTEELHIGILIKRVDSGNITPSDISNYSLKIQEDNTTPIELCKIGDYQDGFAKNSGEQLIPFTNQDFTINGIRYYIKNGVLYFNGTSSGETYSTNANFKSNFAFTLEAGTYYLTTTNELTTYIDNKSTGTHLRTGTGSFILSETTEVNLGFYVYNKTFSNQPTYIMLVKGETAPTTYEPYGTGLWCKYNAIGKATWLTDSKYPASYQNISAFTCNKPTNANDYGKAIVSTYIFESAEYSSNNSNWDNADLIGKICNRAELNRIWTIMAVGVTLEQAKALIDGKIYYYILSSPYLSLIEDNNLIEQLDNIQNAMSYSGQTNISQVNNDKPFIIDAKALEQGSDEVVVNNIGNATSKPLIALEGTGNINIYLDGTQVLQANVEDKMNIDIDKLEAYNPDTSALLNRQVTGNYNSMTLPSGNSTIKIDGALDKATITNYQRWL